MASTKGLFVIKFDVVIYQESLMKGIITWGSAQTSKPPTLTVNTLMADGPKICGPCSPIKLKEKSDSQGFGLLADLS